MNKFLKTLTAAVICISAMPAFASLDKTIKTSPLNETSTVAVSVKEVDTGKTVYEYNPKKLLHPASTMKVFSIIPALDSLTKDYVFTTGFYVYNNDLYIKLGADPLLTSLNLKDSIKVLKAYGYKTFRNIYIDDSILDNVEWGVGWMWDDGTNELMQKYGAYNLDNNIYVIDVSKDEVGHTSVKAQSTCPVSVLNNVLPGEKTRLTALRHDWVAPDIICVKGTVALPSTVKVPVNNLRRYFEYRLSDILSRQNVKLETAYFAVKTVPSDAKLVTEITHSVMTVVPDVLKNSNNKNCETIFKVAGAKNSFGTGTLENSVKNFYDYWNQNDVDTTNIIVADASGISRNNLINVDFMTNALNKIYSNEGFDFIKANMAQPGEGTLSDRMLNLRGSIFLKTGTLENISGITGYVISDKGKIYSVAILIQNFTYPKIQVKQFENELIKEIKNL